MDRIAFIKRDFLSILLIGHYRQDFVESFPPGSVVHLPYLKDDALVDQLGQPHQWGHFDLIVANLNLHWVNDLPGMLWQIRSLLKPDGLFLGSFLGGETLRELKAAFLQAEMELLGGLSPRVIPMVDLYSASQLLLRADFKLPVADRDTITATYPSVTNLLHDLRKAGQTNVMQARHKSMCSRKLFQRVEALYTQNHSLPDVQLPATFEIIYLTGWSYHESQQKALKPGSAQLSLKSYLETSPSNQ